MEILKQQTFLKDSALSQVKNETFNGFVRPIDGFGFSLVKTEVPQTVGFGVTTTFEITYPLGSKFYFEALTVTWFNDNNKKPLIKDLVGFMNYSFAENAKLLQIEFEKYKQYITIDGEHQQSFDKEQILSELQVAIDECYTK